jgi:hypothetical protein
LFACACAVLVATGPLLAAIIRHLSIFTHAVNAI